MSIFGVVRQVAGAAYDGQNLSDRVTFDGLAVSIRRSKQMRVLETRC